MINYILTCNKAPHSWGFLFVECWVDLEKEFIIKRVLLISLLLIIGCAKPINENLLVDRNGMKYQQDSQNPYSGEVFELFNNGNKKLEGSYKNGEKNGKWTVWYENGQKGSEITYKNGKLDELWTQWNENGQKETERNDILLSV